jgi:hypothetical protein
MIGPHRAALTLATHVSLARKVADADDGASSTIASRDGTPDDLDQVCSFVQTLLNCTNGVRSSASMRWTSGRTARTMAAAIWSSVKRSF